MFEIERCLSIYVTATMYHTWISSWMSVDELIVGNVGITFWHEGRMWSWKNKEIQKNQYFWFCCIYLFFFFFPPVGYESTMLNWSSAPTLTTTPTVYSTILPCLIKKIYLCNKAVSGRSLHSDENQWLENMRKQITKINESIFKDVLFTSGRISESRGCHWEHKQCCSWGASLSVCRSEGEHSLENNYSADFFSPVGSSFFPR